MRPRSMAGLSEVIPDERVSGIKTAGMVLLWGVLSVSQPAGAEQQSAPPLSGTLSLGTSPQEAMGSNDLMDLSIEELMQLKVTPVSRKERGPILFSFLACAMWKSHPPPPSSVVFGGYLIYYLY